MTELQKGINEIIKIIYEEPEKHRKNLQDRIYGIITKPHFKKWKINLDISKKIKDLIYQMMMPEYGDR